MCPVLSKMLPKLLERVKSYDTKCIRGHKFVTEILHISIKRENTPFWNHLSPMKYEPIYIYIWQGFEKHCKYLLIVKNICYTYYIIIIQGWKHQSSEKDEKGGQLFQTEGGKNGGITVFTLKGVPNETPNMLN